MVTLTCDNCGKQAQLDIVFGEPGGCGSFVYYNSAKVQATGEWKFWDLPLRDSIIKRCKSKHACSKECRKAIEENE